MSPAESIRWWAWSTLRPTVCGLLGIESDSPIQGTDLSPLIWGESLDDDERPQYCESITATKYNASPLFGLVQSHWKYIHTTRPELYDLRADSGETNNLVDQHPARAMAMHDNLSRMLQLEPAATDAQQPPPSDDVAQRLSSLGYIGGGTGDRDFTVETTRSDPKDLVQFHQSASQVITLINQSEYPKARQVCEELVSQHPEISEGHYLFGMVFHAPGQD